MVAVELDERCNILAAKSRVTSIDNVLEVCRGNLRWRNVERHDFVGQVRETQVLPAFPGSSLWNVLGNIESAIGS